MKLEDRISKSGFTVVKFSATWCGPCKTIDSAVLIPLETAKTITVVRIDIEKEQELAEQYDIATVPTLRFYKDGDYIGTVVGAVNMKCINDVLNGTQVLEK